MISRLFIFDVYIHTILHFATLKTKGSRVRHMEKEQKALIVVPSLQSIREVRPDDNETHFRRSTRRRRRKKASIPPGPRTGLRDRSGRSQRAIAPKGQSRRTDSALTFCSHARHIRTNQIDQPKRSSMREVQASDAQVRPSKSPAVAPRPVRHPSTASMSPQMRNAAAKINPSQASPSLIESLAASARNPERVNPCFWA